MNPVDDSPGLVIRSAQDVMNMEEAALVELQELESELNDDMVNNSLASHIMTNFRINKEARQTSGMDEKMLQSLRAYNGRYDPEDVAKIREVGGSSIYMNLTATKCRAAMSWIRDIMMSANEKSFAFKPTPVPDLPLNVEEQIKEEIQQFMQDRLQMRDDENALEDYEHEMASMQKQEQEKQMSQQEAQQAQQPQGAEGQQGPQGAPPPAPPKKPKAPSIPKPVRAASEMKDMNQMFRDIYEAFQDEVYKMAESEVKKFEKVVEDQLVEGAWEKAFSEFIEDFCVFPVAVMKGPIVTKKKRLSWEDGSPKIIDDFIFLNKRISPFDIYPSPNATEINEGNLCEHMRLDRGELYSFIGIDGYNDENIREVLENCSEGSYQWLDTQIEEDKVIEEFRGNSIDANRGIFHGIHFHGTASGEVLRDFGIDEIMLHEDPLFEHEIEAILVGNKVIKVAINEDPLLRRPYYKASFHNMPGSWWGRSLPELMRDIQRMCNAASRALSNNMGIASGPQVEVYVDRLAADEEVESIYPFKLWQVNSDPTGSGGRAVTFWQPTSNASELLAVYKEFEIRADDATGVPRYSYGNERVGGAAQTASGLSMLLESANKGIKDAIRHIDDGLIKPRIEYQFYYHLVSTPDVKFSGDILVVPLGSSALTVKGAQEQRRNEFLQILTSPVYMDIVGIEGLADILREMAKSLGLGNSIVPSRIELKFKQAQAKIDAAKQQQAMMESQQTQSQVGIQQVKMQTDQAEAASQRIAELKAQELQLKQQVEARRDQLKVMEMEMRREESVNKVTASLTKQQMADAQKDRNTNKNIALSIQSGYEDKNNTR